MSEKLDRFVELLRKIFELDKSDLDFGIYRIMNIRKSQIDEFLSKKLPEQVKKAVEHVADCTTEVRRRMDELKKQAAAFNADVEQNEEYKVLKERSQPATDLSALETDVYTYLYNFFSRYYDEGDFVSKRRYKEGIYAIPYEGEEVKLYWANQDQYYIKTTENFKDYSFTSDGVTVRFMLVDATTEQNNNKENGKKRAFMLFTENEGQPGIKTFEKKGNEFIIRFIYDLSEVKQKEWNEKNYTTIKEYIVRNHDKLIPLITPSITFNEEQISPIQKHLLSYVAKNTFDYFIHKDLGGFLNRELDFFIKNEIMHLDDIDTNKEEHVSNYLAKVRAVKKVGKTIIDFLAQIENFQKRLWLKKKFVIRTDYCITLDKIPEKHYEEIRKNKAQVQEWIDLYAIDEVIRNGDLELAEKWTNPPTVEFLKANKNLVIDTKHFNPLFKEAIISCIDNLDEEVNGVLIHSENFQALNLLTEKYSEQINCVYIDPPYNTDASEIMYKNNYKNSSFISLMEGRLNVVKQIMTNNSIIAISIDDAEMPLLQNLLEQTFAKNVGIAIVRSNPQSRKAKGKFSPVHEYCLFYAKREDTVPHSIGTRQEKLKRYPLKDDLGNYAWLNFIRAGNNDLRSDRPKLYYPIAVAEDDSIRILKMRWDNEHNEYTLLEKPRKNEVLVFPNKTEGRISIEKNWQRGHERVATEISSGEYRVRRVNGDISIDFKTRIDEDALPITWWDKKEYASANYFPNEIKALFGKTLFDFGKALMIINDAICASGADENDVTILDYFAGSGTTGHAVINLNRNDEGNRKYILVEVGDYFNSVTKPRMQKVVYAKDWKEGKPTSRHTGVSQIIKYFNLENYEDTLTNLEFSDSPEGKSLKYGDNYLINYMLDVETKGSLLNIEKIKEPFDYLLRITERNEIKEAPIDLVETFNYLIGLNVVKNYALRFYNATKINNEREDAVDLKEDKNGDFRFKQLEGSLNDGSRILIIWRNITDNLSQCNAALDAYFQKSRPNTADRDFDIIYVNGDNNIENLRAGNDRWNMRIIETEFMERMFED